MNRNLWLLTLCQGLLLTNNVAFIAINGLVGLRLAPEGWMATLPVMGYVVGAALATPVVAKVQARWGRRTSFQTGLAVACISALIAVWAIERQLFWGVVGATVLAGYYSANGQLYRFAAAELAQPNYRERAVSMVLAGGIVGGVLGPNLAQWAQHAGSVPFAVMVKIVRSLNFVNLATSRASQSSSSSEINVGLGIGLPSLRGLLRLFFAACHQLPQLRGSFRQFRVGHGFGLRLFLHFRFSRGSVTPLIAACNLPGDGGIARDSTPPRSQSDA